MLVTTCKVTVLGKAITVLPVSEAKKVENQCFKALTVFVLLICLSVN